MIALMVVHGSKPAAGGGVVRFGDATPLTLPCIAASVSPNVAAVSERQTSRDERRR